MFCGAVHLMLAGFTNFRIVHQRPVPAAVKKAFVVDGGTTPAVLSLDPRSDGQAGRESGGEAREAG